ncbi:MAG: FIST C-terminal domain-containing protein [Myxococcales bacterium]|nr:FIST C-terminal domain-containing protein [Myxococcales bacterium]
MATRPSQLTVKLHLLFTERPHRGVLTFMRWSAYATLASDLSAAMPRAAAQLTDGLGGHSPDLVLAFASPALDDNLALQLQQAFPTAVIAGSAASGVIGGHQELEQRPALSLVGAKIPNTRIEIMSVRSEDQELRPAEVKAALGPDGDPTIIIALVDANSPQYTQTMELLDTAFPSTTVVGGLSSGLNNRPALLVNHRVSGAKAVFIALHGGLQAHSVIAQGCRPIGQPMLVTRSDGHIIQELAQKRPLDVMRNLHDALGEQDQQLFQRSLFIGIEMKDQLEYHQGDFLIRNVLGIESKLGGLAINVPIEQWKVVQFHLRDAAASSDDLHRMLKQAQTQATKPMTALLFSCIGRGEGLYGQPSHDTRTIRHFFGNIPVGGFFCNGEIGRIGEKTYLHGYTSAIALISEADTPPLRPKESPKQL